MSTPSEVVTSRTNARVKQLRAAFAGQARLSGGLVAIEGEHLLREALRSGIIFKAVFLSERFETVPRWIPYGVEVLRLANDVFHSVVETQSPQGLAALIIPPTRKFEDVLGASSEATLLIVVACGLQDPGNLGTLVRSAEAFGATGVLTTAGTVSAWNQKALRASVGSIFRVPVATATLDEVAGLRAGGTRLLAAVGENGAPAPAVDLAGACALLIGNEGNGLPSEWLAIADAQVTIPCPGPVESLNAAVAGSLLLYEANRQRMIR